MSIRTYTPYVLAPAEGDDLWMLGGLYSFKALGEATENAYTLCQVEGPSGFAAPMHVHDHEDEAFYVARGRVTLFIDGEAHSLADGGFAFVPRGHAHTFRFETPDTRLLLLVTPGASGHETMFRAMGAPAARHAVPNPGEGMRLDPVNLARIAAENGTRVVGPPPM